MAVYLWVMFGLMALHASVVLAERHMSYRFYGFAIVNSLILAKVMLVAEDLHFGENFKDQAVGLSDFVQSVFYLRFYSSVLTWRKRLSSGWPGARPLPKASQTSAAEVRAAYFLWESSSLSV